MTNRCSAPCFPSLVAVVVLTLVSACAGQASSTPDLTDQAIRGATVLAALPTAESLTPQPTQTPAPTATPAIPTALPSPVPPTAVAKPPVATPGTVDYTVKAGDSLSSIAAAYHVSMAAIMLANNMGDSQVVKLGQVLHIPTARSWPDENVFWFVYIVQPGEALSSIAVRFHVKLDDLVRINQLTDASSIRVGQKLVIPAKAYTPNELPTAEPTIPRGAAAADEPATNQVVAQAPAPQKPAAPVAPAQQANVQVLAAHVASIAGADAMRGALLSLYNQARAAAGLAPLAASAILQSAAQGHADDCAQRGYGSHFGSDGSTIRQRILRAGYPGTYVSENWAWSTSVAQAFDMWFNQEASGGPHRSNILNTRFTQVGFGVSITTDGYYFIADFGAP